MRRHEITDEQWDRIKDSLPGKLGDPGRTAVDNRLFINAVLWIAKVEVPPDGVECSLTPEQLSANLDDKGQKKP